MTRTPRNIEAEAIRTCDLIGICIVNTPVLGRTAPQKLVPPREQLRALSHSVARMLVSPEGVR